MIDNGEASIIAQAYLDQRMSLPKRIWCPKANALVDRVGPRLLVWQVNRSAGGFIVTYNTRPPSLAGHRPIHVGLDGTDVGIATWREIWEADPGAYPWFRHCKERLILLQEQNREPGSPREDLDA